MVSLAATRNMLLFSAALAAGAAAFWIALGRDEGTPMQLPVLPRIHATAPPVAKATPPAPPPTYVPPPMPPVTTTGAPAKPDPTTAQEIERLVEATSKRLDKTLSPPSMECTAVPVAEQKRIQKAVARWIDARTPDEKNAPAGYEGTYEVSIGCAEPEGVLVAVAADRLGKHQTESYNEVRRNYVLRVTGDQITVIAERTSTAKSGWSEWADEGGYGTVGTLDFDGDGRRDTIYLDKEHEGGAMHEHTSVMVREAGGTVAKLATITDLPGIAIANGKLLVAANKPEGHETHWRCLAPDLALSTCPEAAAWEAYSAKYDALARVRDGTSWNREQLAADFATLGITGHANLVKAMPPEPVANVVREHVEQFLVATHQYDPADVLIERVHPDAVRFFDGLASQLGDKRCTPSQLTDDVTKRVTAWVTAHAKLDRDVAIETDCGNYVWASYESEAKAFEILFAVDGATLTKVVTLPGVMYEGPGDAAFNHFGGFFTHGDALVGGVFAGHTLYAIANGKIVGKRDGELRAIDYATGEADTSFDLASEGKSVLHATSTGIEKIDPEPLRPHQVHRAALERVIDTYQPIDKTYLAALRTLGAPEALIAQAKLAL